MLRSCARALQRRRPALGRLEGAARPTPRAHGWRQVRWPDQWGETGSPVSDTYVKCLIEQGVGPVTKSTGEGRGFGSSRLFSCRQLETA